MTEPTPITIPLINPNEPGALLAELHVIPGNHVAFGDKLCTLETTKSTVELTAEANGYVVGLAFQAGQTVQAGEILGYLADSPNWIPPAIPAKHSWITTRTLIRFAYQPAGPEPGTKVQLGSVPHIYGSIYH